MSDNLFGNPEQNQQQTQQLPEGVVNKNTEPTSVQDPPKTGEEVNKPPESVVTDPNSLFADQLASIKAEDGRQKYADVPTALASIPHAQGRIKELSDEVKQLRAQLEQSQNAEELLKRMEEVSNGQQEVTPSIAGLDAEAAEQLFENLLQRKTAEQQQEANKKLVLDSLTSKYGDKAEEVFNKRANDLGMSVKDLSVLSLTHPKIVLSQFDDGNQVVANSVQGTVNSSVMPKPSQPEKRSVMRGASSKQVVEQFRLHAAQD